MGVSISVINSDRGGEGWYVLPSPVTVVNQVPTEPRASHNIVMPGRCILAQYLCLLLNPLPFCNVKDIHRGISNIYYLARFVIYIGLINPRLHNTLPLRHNRY